MNKKFLLRFLVFLVIIISAFTLFIFTKEKIVEQNDKLVIVTTLFPLYDFAKNIGGEKTETFLLLPPGVEPHGFEPTPSDIIKINQADLFIYTGKFMETWAEDIIQGMTNKETITVDASFGIELLSEEEEESEEEHQGVDPHFWLDFSNAQKIVDTITASMSEKDPINADYYKNNANNFKLKLVDLENKYLTELKDCQNRKIIYGGHYAFGYLAKKYDLSYVAAQGFSPNSEPTAKDLVGLVQQIEENNIDYIFCEELSSPKIAQTLAEETQIQIRLLNPAGNLSKEDYDNNITFISIMENNLKNLIEGLKCL